MLPMSFTSPSPSIALRIKVRTLLTDPNSSRSSFSLLPPALCLLPPAIAVVSNRQAQDLSVNFSNILLDLIVGWVRNPSSKLIHKREIKPACLKWLSSANASEIIRNEVQSTKPHPLSCRNRLQLKLKASLISKP